MWDMHVNEWMMIYFSVSFAKEPYKKDSILQKRPTYICVTPQTHVNEWGELWSWVTAHIAMGHPFSHVWHDSFTCVIWFIHICDKSHSHVWQDSFTCVTWLIHMCDMTPSHVWCPKRTNTHVTHVNSHMNRHVMIYSSVSFAKEPCKRDSILQQRPIYICVTPQTYQYSCHTRE